MPQGTKTVAIDLCPESALRYLDHDAIVCIDVIRATTTLVTAVAGRRRAFAAADYDEALEIAAGLKDPLLAGTDPQRPRGYEIPNSPHAVSGRGDVWRPLVLVSTYGTRLLANSRCCRSVFVASLRNLTATADALASGYRQVALLGAGSLAGLRCEDRIATARLAALLLDRGFRAGTHGTVTALKRWAGADTEIIRLGRSAESLLKTGQRADLEYILSHIDDLDFACESVGAEVMRALDRVPLQPGADTARRANPACGAGQPGDAPRGVTGRARHRSPAGRAGERSAN